MFEGSLERGDQSQLYHTLSRRKARARLCPTSRKPSASQTPRTSTHESGPSSVSRLPDLLGQGRESSRRLAQAQETVQRLLYVASPGVRNYLEYGGHAGCWFSISTTATNSSNASRPPGVDEKGTPSTSKESARRRDRQALRQHPPRPHVPGPPDGENPLGRTYERAATGCRSRRRQDHYLPSLVKEGWNVVNGSAAM